MRTSIVLDDELVAQARKLTEIATKRELVEVAFRLLIRLHEQAEVLKLRGKLQWQGDLEEMRATRRGAGWVMLLVDSTVLHA